jgi:DNA-binding transcriptional regulator YhcF (GntR family)
VGARLPSCEQLGRDIGANKNTVSKAYQALARRGYVESHPGRGTFVTRRPHAEDRREAIAEIETLLREAVEHADLVGLTLDEFFELASASARRYYDRVTLRIGYVEGTRADARQLGRQLQTAVSMPVEPVIVDQVIKDPDAIVARYDLLAVNVSYLATVERRPNSAVDRSRTEIIPILSQPDPLSMTAVARLAEGTCLAIIVETEDSLPVLSGLAKAFNPSLEIVESLRSSHTLRRTLARADAVLITTEAESNLGRLARPVPIIEVAWRLDEISITALAERIASRTKVP